MNLLEMLHEPVDPRLLKTQDEMSAAIRKLWKSGAVFDTITVAKLCQTAGVSRQTFYRRYGSVAEVVSVDTVRMLGSMLQEVESDHTSVFAMEPKIAVMVHGHADLFAEVKWSHSEEAVVNTMTGGILRLFYLQGVTVEHKAIIAEMMARNTLSLGQTLAKYPGLSLQETEKVVKLLMPSVSIMEQRRK